MLTKLTHIVAAKVCFTVFFMKMLISATPMFADVLDKGTILQVVLQLEIENTAKASSLCEDIHETGSKYFNTDLSDYLFFCPQVENSAKQTHYLKNERLIQAFHPSVPTPPPNC